MPSDVPHTLLLPGSSPRRRSVPAILCARAIPDASTAAALDAAADRAEARGAQAASGELREWAAQMTPDADADADARAGRLLAAGQATFVSGGAERARALLERVASAPGPSRHEAL